MSDIATRSSALDLAGITKRFGGNVVLSDVSLTIEPGTLHFVIGPNGAGKTTLFNIISGFFPPDSGTIRLFDRDVTNLSARQRARAGVARTFQNLQLFDSLTVIENVLIAIHGRMRSGLLRSMIGWRIAEEEHREYAAAYDLLERFDLGRFAESSPADLSYGDRRLVEIVRSLAMQPKVLLLDEPAAGLGLGARGDLFNVLKDLRSEELTIVLIEHDMKFGMALADDVTVLDLGRRIANGPPREVQQDQEVIRAYLGTGKKAAS